MGGAAQLMRVLKLGGRAQNDARLPMIVRDAWRRGPGEYCVVHGGGDEITALQIALGKSPTFVNGRRVTTDDDLQILRMVLSGVINKRLVESFGKAGVPAVGISGEDGAIIAARRPETGDEMFGLGAVGVPQRVNAHLLNCIITAGYLPVISPLGNDVSDSGVGALNVNGDDAAAAIAVALGASELLFVADVEGVQYGNSVLPNLDLGDVPRLIQEGAVSDGMIAKLDAAKTALSGGVAQVRISDVGGIVADARGTTVTTAPGRAE